MYEINETIPVALIINEKFLAPVLVFLGRPLNQRRKGNKSHQYRVAPRAQYVANQLIGLTFALIQFGLHFSLWAALGLPPIALSRLFEMVLFSYLQKIHFVQPIAN